MLSIPILVVWVFGIQFLILLYLVKHKRRLNSIAVKKYFHIIYIGYREERFYWEFVNTFKKFILIAFNVFLSQVSKSYKGMAAIISLIILVRIQMFLKPYKLKINNEIENSSMVAIGFTLYGGLLFMKGQSQVSFIEAFAFILIIVINSVYIMFWIYLMAKTYDRHEVAKKISALLKIVLFRGENDTVLTGTNEGSSNPNIEYKNPPPITKKNIKGVKHQINEAIKYNPLKDDSISSFLRNKVKFSDNKDLLKIPRKLKKKKRTNEHEEFWDNLHQNLEESKRGSFDIIDFIEKIDRATDEPNIKVQEDYFMNNKAQSKLKINNSGQVVHILKL